jgi:succinyl-diaminopimelate desuccinylase
VAPVNDLLSAAAELVDIPSVSRSERRLADHVEKLLRQHDMLEVDRTRDNVVARSNLGRARRVLLAGHLDTVPPFGEAAARVDGETLWGLGAVDMKGGLAVMLALVDTLERARVDVTFVFYACEEIERSASGLAQLATQRNELLRADVAVLLEPTRGLVEAGCQGTLHAVVTLRGRRAHTARPYMGLNAVHRLADLLRGATSYEPRSVVIDGCTYTEQLQAVEVSGGVARNVVPDRATALFNMRFAPDKDAREAEAELRVRLAAGLDESLGDALEVVGAAPGAPPSLGEPLLAALVEATQQPPRAKLGWTDVATFHELGIPAANFGPGDPSLAHTADERVSLGELRRALEVLEHLLSTEV